MTTAVDSNVVIALWDRGHSPSSSAPTALEAALNRGSLLVGSDFRKTVPSACETCDGGKCCGIG